MAGSLHPLSSSFLGRLKCAGRGPSRIHVSEVKSVELCPEDVTFGTESGVSSVLFFTRTRVFDNPSERELCVLRSLCEAAAEIVEPAGKPRIVPAHAVYAQRDELVGEKLGQGRGNRFQMRTRGDQFNVSLHGESCGWKDTITAESELAGEARGFH
jgi:hypothetical protein